MLRRPRSLSSKRRILGTRESYRPARRLRRGEALCRSDDHGVSPLPQRGHSHRAYLQYLRAADAIKRRPRAAEFRLSGAERPTANCLWGWETDAELLLCVGLDRGHLPADDV